MAIMRPFLLLLLISLASPVCAGPIGTVEQQTGFAELIRKGEKQDTKNGAAVEMMDDVRTGNGIVGIGFEWRWQDGSPNLDMQPGHAYAMNIHYHHGLWNKSNEDRYFIIASRNDSLPEWKKIVIDAANQQGVVGNFITINSQP